MFVKEQLGHSSIQITVDTYPHLIPGANRAAVDRLVDAPVQLSATQAQPEQEDATLAEMKELLGVVSRIFASWNQLDGWLRQIEVLRCVA